MHVPAHSLSLLSSSLCRPPLPLLPPLATFSQLKRISEQVGPEAHAICALSGGVDSTVAATLIHKVLGDRLHCVFVDNGLLRYNVSTGSLVDEGAASMNTA